MTGDTETAADRPVEDLPTGQLISRALEQMTTLVRDEVALAQAEMAAKAKKAGLGAGLLGGAGLIGVYGVGCLIAAAILGLATVVDGWLAALIVGAALLAAAGIAAVIGKRDVTQSVPPVPQEAVAGLKADVGAVKEGLHR